MAIAEGGRPDTLAEAISMFLMSQVEGLHQERAIRAFGVIDEACVTAGCSDGARAHVRERFTDLFPHVKLPSHDDD